MRQKKKQNYPNLRRQLDFSYIRFCYASCFSNPGSCLFSLNSSLRFRRERNKGKNIGKTILEFDEKWWNIRVCMGSSYFLWAGTQGPTSRTTANTIVICNLCDFGPNPRPAKSKKQSYFHRCPSISAAIRCWDDGMMALLEIADGI